MAKHTTYGGVKGKPAGMHGAGNKKSSLVQKETEQLQAKGYPRKGHKPARVKNSVHAGKKPNNK